MFKYIFVNMRSVSFHIHRSAHAVGSAEPQFTRMSLFIETQGHSLSDMVLQDSQLTLRELSRVETAFETSSQTSSSSGANKKKCVCVAIHYQEQVFFRQVRGVLFCPQAVLTR